MNYTVERCIPDTHPTLPGHFPDHPVIPGVVLLEEVLTALHRWRPEASIRGFRNVKFMRPVTPGLPFIITLEMPAPDSIRFACRTGDITLNAGTVILNPHQAVT